jgi:hypothetical protein
MYTAFELGQMWTGADRPDRAATIYQLILSTHPGHERAGEAQTLLAAL